MVNALKRKVEKVLREALGKKADIRLEIVPPDRVRGMVLSAKFETDSPCERQDRIWKSFDAKLTREERGRIGFIVTDTPLEYEALRKAAAESSSTGPAGRDGRRRILATSLRTKVQKALRKAVGKNAVIRLHQVPPDGVGGVVLSASFETESSGERQDRVWKWLDANLTREERRRIGFIVTDTPVEYEAIKRAEAE
jgi:hypothetical protein